MVNIARNTMGFLNKIQYDFKSRLSCIRVFMKVMCILCIIFIQDPCIVSTVKSLHVQCLQWCCFYYMCPHFIVFFVTLNNVHFYTNTNVLHSLKTLPDIIDFYNRGIFLAIKFIFISRKYLLFAKDAGKWAWKKFCRIFIIKSLRLF